MSTILSRDDLHEATLGAVGGGVLIATAFWFRAEIERYIGIGIPSWVFGISTLLCVGLALRALVGWADILRWERNERRLKAEEERENAKDEAEREKYAAFLSWARQNPRTADRLMAIVEHEQIDDPEHLTWLRDRREKEGPNALTDLSRLYDWLQARQDLRQYGIEIPLFLS